METLATTNRKGFLKRAGLAIVGVFAVSSAARTTSQKQSQEQSKTASQGTSSVAGSAMARVRTAKGAVARKT